MYFFDYGNAFLLEASRAGANILTNLTFFIESIRETSRYLVQYSISIR